MSKLAEYVFLFIIGGVFFNIIEILFIRGWTHWTMFLLAGVCFLCLGLMNERKSRNTPLWKQMLMGMGMITVLEFITGCVVNLKLGWGIWNYSNMPGNLFGQICPEFSIIWFFLSGLGIVLDGWLRYKVFGEEPPHYKIF